jgi:hypothetical protein
MLHVGRTKDRVLFNPDAGRRAIAAFWRAAAMTPLRTPTLLPCSGLAGLF